MIGAVVTVCAIGFLIWLGAKIADKNGSSGGVDLDDDGLW